MDSSCGDSSVGVKAGEELWKNSVIEAPTSVLQSMRERLFLLEIQEKKRKEEQEKKDKEEEEKKERLLKDKAKADAGEGAGKFKAREKSKAKRAKEEAAKDWAGTQITAAVTYRTALPEFEAAFAEKARRAKGKKGRASTEVCAGITRANAEEAARPTGLAHGALEINMSGESSIELKARDELGKITEIQANQRNQIVEPREAQEEAVEAERAKPMAATNKPMGKPQKPAKVTAARIAKMMAEGAAMIRNMTPEERDRIIAKSMAEKSASKADEAAEAKEDANEARRLKDKESEWAQCEGELFAAKFRSFWNKYYTDCGATFEQTTSIPAMCHTYPASDCSTKAMDTLQIMSVKVTSIKDGLGLHWPLEVFGMIAARDVLDHKRNIIFDRPRTDCQIITKDDCYLALTGPTRAVAVSVDPSYIEVSLKVKGTTEAEDTDLSDLVLMYRTGCYPGSVFPSRISTLEIEFRHINRSVEATVHIKVIGGSWPDGFRGEFSAGISSSDDLQVKLLDFEDGGLPVNADGEITLSRRVVSVGVESNLKVSVRACPINKGHAAKSSEAVLKSQRAGTSPSGIKLSVGSCSMEVSVAWSCFRYAW